MANKYDAMIAALDMLQNITDKPDWMLREEELKLREKMHNDEMEMSLMMTQIKNEQDAIDHMDGQIADYNETLIDMRSRIQSTGNQLNKLPDYKQTGSGQKTPEQMYADVDSKYQNTLVQIERNKRDRQQVLDELKWKVSQRGDELGLRIGEQAVKDAEYKGRAEQREIDRLSQQEIINKQLNDIRENQEIRTASKFNLSDPAYIEDQLNLSYSAMKTLTGEDGALSAESIKELAEASGGVYADNADLIANQLTQMFASSATGEAFLTALQGEDMIYQSFLTQDGMDLTKNNIQSMLTLSLSNELQGVKADDPINVIKGIIGNLPELRRRK
jgi:uncharacterized protein YukE